MNDALKRCDLEDTHERILNNQFLWVCTNALK